MTYIYVVLTLGKLSIFNKVTHTNKTRKNSLPHDIL